jgi:GNAT superfamily N-acetyltransferase
MTGPPLELRTATPEDATAIAETFVAAGRAAWGHIVAPAQLEAMPPPVDTWRERLVHLPPRDVVLVAVAGGVVVGFVWVTPDTAEPGVGCVETFYTRPDVWGGGVGRALLDAGVTALRDAGCRAAMLWTEARNHRPRRVYESDGWRADGTTRERTFLGSPLVEVRYRRTW